MNATGILEKLRETLDIDKKKKRREALHKVLKKLKKKELKFKAALGAAKADKEKKKLGDTLKVIKAQRKKGVKELRKLSGKE